MKKKLIFLMKGNLGLPGVIPPVVPTSSITLLSTGSLSSPSVGDILYFDKDYISTTSNLEDYTSTGTQIVFKRDGVSIPLINGATQYIITQDDIGTVISLEVTIKEQGGSIQPVLTGTTTGVVTGSTTWTIGELQTTYEALYDMTRNDYPAIQRHSTDTPTDVYKVRSLNGTRVDLKSPQQSNIMSFDTTNNYIFGAANGRMQFSQSITNYDGVNASFFFRFTMGSADMWPFRFMGDTNRYLQCENAPTNRFEIPGIRTANDILYDGDEVIVILRFSDTPFTTINGVTGQRTEFYIKIISGTTPGEHYYDSTVNLMSGANHSHGFELSATTMQTGTAPFYKYGMSASFMSDTDMNNLITDLTAT